MNSNNELAVWISVLKECDKFGTLYENLDLKSCCPRLSNENSHVLTCKLNNTVKWVGLSWF